MLCCAWVCAFLPLVARTSHHMWGVQAVWTRGTRDDQRKRWRKRREAKWNELQPVIVPECGSERSADDVKRCTHIWNSLNSCTWREELLRKASAGTFSFFPRALFFFFFLLLSLNLSLSGLRLPERWNGYPLSISKEERVNRSEREEEREGTRGQ